eukprot:jgi/Chrzof1/4080/Cz13g19140.t1
MDNVKDAANKAADAADSGLHQAAQATKQAVAYVSSKVQEASESSRGTFEQLQASVSDKLDYLNEQQDKAFTAAKDGIEYIITNPMIGYPVLAIVAVLAVPGVSRVLYRQTLGRLRDPQAVVSSAEQRLNTLGAKVEDYGREAQKLQARAAAADEEMTRGYNKLKAARAELQRLESAVAKDESMVNKLLSDLRDMRRVQKATELRADAAQKAATLKQQRTTLQNEIYKIARKDV